MYNYYKHLSLINDNKFNEVRETQSIIPSNLSENRGS